MKGDAYDHLVCTICPHEYEKQGDLESCYNCGADPTSIIPLGKVSEDQAASDVEGVPETLEAVRARARKKLKGICAVYPACDGKEDRICQREAYGKPIGFGGAGSGASFAANISSLAKWRLKTRLVGDHFDPDTRLMLCDRDLSMPVMGAPTGVISRYNEAITEKDFCRATIRGCRYHRCSITPGAFASDRDKSYEYDCLPRSFLHQFGHTDSRVV